MAVADVGLKLLEPDGEAAVGRAGADGRRLCGREPNVLVRLNVDEVGEERLGSDNEALDRDVDLFVRVVNPRNGDVAGPVDGGRQDEFAEVVPDLGLDGEGAALVEKEVLGELPDIRAEPGVERVCSRV